MRQPFVAGNWKMNGSRASVRELLLGLTSGVAAFSRAEIAVCPPYLYVSQVSEALTNTAIRWGAQDVWTEPEGAYTGDISAAMLRDFGCTYVIVGHSERRTLHGEGDDLVAKKFIAASTSGLVPILCVGETLREREQDVTEAVIARQLDAVVAAAGINAFAQAVVAYEPVWAIGTGRTATPDQAEEVHRFIRNRIASLDLGIAESLRILYGGSVKPDNAVVLFGKPDIDGGLIGGAALSAAGFNAICRAADLSE